jgi:hypothetical protein
MGWVSDLKKNVKKYLAGKKKVPDTVRTKAVSKATGLTDAELKKLRGGK